MPVFQNVLKQTNPMNSKLKRAIRALLGQAAVVAILILTGCAHSISMAPDLAKIPPARSKIPKTVGYVITDATRWLEVTTRLGSGDKLRYTPYKDLEPGFSQALSEVFDHVVKLSGSGDSATIRTQGVSFIITPTITTAALSGFSYWPPNSFSIELNCAVLDARGQPVAQIKSQGQGRATYDEFMQESGLAARRAAEDALANLVQALAESPELRR